MKKLMMMLALSVCAAGCGGPASQSGVWKHETLYRNWDHMQFSWGGHKDVTDTDVRKSTEEQWWGKDVPAKPGK